MILIRFLFPQIVQPYFKSLFMLIENTIYSILVNSCYN